MFCLIVHNLFSPKDTKLQVVLIFTSLQNAKFTDIAGYTSCRPTDIKSFMTIFGQCINVLIQVLCILKLLEVHINLS